MVSWERARDEAQKRERREAILAAARRLLDDAGFESVSLNAIGREVGLSKSNLYRYFESREEILLQVFIDEHEHWIAAVEKGLAPLAGHNDPRAIARVFVGEALARPRLGVLGTMLASVLERHLSEDAVVRFKSQLWDSGLRVCNALVVAAPRLSAQRARTLLEAFYALAAGLVPMCTPSVCVQAALKRPELRHMIHDFDRDCTEAFALMLQGALTLDGAEPAGGVV